MKDTPPEYNDDDLRDVNLHNKPCLVRRKTQHIGIVLFVLIVLIVLITFVASR